ncbi:MAG TPA: heparan-alpha-glucosaminide N-acetyltransferase [Miltoncostaeaceae bacterium]|nr:heparan-alpha-glucosaminide N-acetyltransferase [Miltoncostaeaceae bacterium]
MTTATVAAGLPAVSATPQRFWEIDLARTVAIVMMVAYHAVYDIELLVPGLGPDPFRGAWGGLPEATGGSFLVVAGVSLAVVDGRLRARGASAATRVRRHLRHAGVVLAAGAVVSLATWLAFDDRFVRFGILHMIAVGVVVGAVAVGLGAWNLVLGAAAIGIGVLVADEPTASAVLGVVGLDEQGFSSVDHWPVLPWIGPVLIGIAVGSLLYPRGERSRRIAAVSSLSPAAWLSAPGRRSLAVYLAHQLVLIPVVWVVLAMAGADVPSPR